MSIIAIRIIELFHLLKQKKEYQFNSYFVYYDIYEANEAYENLFLILSLWLLLSLYTIQADNY